MNKILLAGVLVLLTTTGLLLSNNSSEVQKNIKGSENIEIVGNETCLDAQENLHDCLYNNPDPSSCSYLQQQCDLVCNNNCNPGMKNLRNETCLDAQENLHDCLYNNPDPSSCAYLQQQCDLVCNNNCNPGQEQIVGNETCQEAEENLHDCLINNPDPSSCSYLQQQCDLVCNNNCNPGMIFSSATMVGNETCLDAEENLHDCLYNNPDPASCSYLQQQCDLVCNNNCNPGLDNIVGNETCQEAEENLHDCLINNPDPSSCSYLQQQCDLVCNNNCNPGINLGNETCLDAEENLHDCLYNNPDPSSCSYLQQQCDLVCNNNCNPGSQNKMIQMVLGNDECQEAQEILNDCFKNDLDPSFTCTYYQRKCDLACNYHCNRRQNVASQSNLGNETCLDAEENLHDCLYNNPDPSSCSYLQQQCDLVCNNNCNPGV